MQITHNKLPSIMSLPFLLDSDSFQIPSLSNDFFSFPQYKITQLDEQNPNIMVQEHEQVPKIQPKPQQTQILTNHQHALNYFYQYPSNMENSIEKKGVWTHEEDLLLCQAVNESKPVLWDVVAEKIPGRNAVQCRERWSR